MFEVTDIHAGKNNAGDTDGIIITVVDPVTECRTHNGTIFHRGSEVFISVDMINKFFDEADEYFKLIK